MITQLFFDSNSLSSWRICSELSVPPFELEEQALNAITQERAMIESLILLIGESLLFMFYK